MQNVSTPDDAYRAFWIWWSICAGLSVAALGAGVIVAGRIWWVNPILRALGK